MNLDKITAENMKNLAEKGGEDINTLLTRIKVEAEEGNNQLYLSGYIIKDNTKKELERRGFKVDIGGRYNEINTVIMWG